MHNELRPKLHRSSSVQRLAQSKTSASWQHSGLALRCSCHCAAGGAIVGLVSGWATRKLIKWLRHRGAKPPQVWLEAHCSGMRCLLRSDYRSSIMSSCSRQVLMLASLARKLWASGCDLSSPASSTDDLHSALCSAESPFSLGQHCAGVGGVAGDGVPDVLRCQSAAGRVWRHGGRGVGPLRQRHRKVDDVRAHPAHPNSTTTLVSSRLLAHLSETN